MDYTVGRPPVALKAHKLTLTQGHQEKWIQKSCLSFEEECTLRGAAASNVAISW